MNIASSILILIGLLGISPIKCKCQEWWFWPKYTLGQRAENYPGNQIPAPVSKVGEIATLSAPLLFFGEEPTERLINFSEPSKLSDNAFTVELWIVNHVNQKVGGLVTLKHKDGVGEPEWLLGMYGKKIVHTLQSEDLQFANAITYEIRERGWKKYWYHITSVYDGNTMMLYVNGELQNQMKIGKRRNLAKEPLELEIASYMKNEPGMDLGGFIKMLRIHPEALSRSSIQSNFEKLKNLVEEGKLHPSLFHFNAGPYLNNVTETSISIVWETDRPADFIIEYGKQIPFDKKLEVTSQKIETEPQLPESNIHKITLQNLEPETPYFYNIKAKAFDGSEMQSGNLTFSTAIKNDKPFSFGVVGDTEARPHVNDQVSKLLWDERPNFLLIVGDLTDGGVRDHKFEWNYEYFQGMTQLASRVPVFPVAGNGEDDLFWYDRYHVLPAAEGFYSFRYGNAEFFMLNSNVPEDFAPGGKQYKWLEEKLKRSTAHWKFVAHHHAPYSSDDDDYGDSWKNSTPMGDLSIRKIVPLYERYNVDMVFFGHLHTYQRTLPIKNNTVDNHNGIIYVQGGGGGGNLEDFAPSRAWFSAKTYRGHHYFTVTISSNELSFRMYDTSGKLKDYLELKK